MITVTIWDDDGTQVWHSNLLIDRQEAIRRLCNLPPENMTATLTKPTSVRVSNYQPIDTTEIGKPLRFVMWVNGDSGPCPDCHGTGVIKLFTSDVPCERCKGGLDANNS